MAAPTLNGPVAPPSRTGLLPGRRVVVVGSSGSGKTTMAHRLAHRAGVPHVELDALNWEANWTEAAPEVFAARVAPALLGAAWVVDGNYSRVRDLVWRRADTLVWLDYPLARILARLTYRTARRVLGQEELWAGNRESVRMSHFSRESIFLWAIQTYRRRRREYTELLAQGEYAHLRVIHFRSPAAADRWLAALPPPGPPG